MTPTRAEVGICPATMLADPFAFTRDDLQHLLDASVQAGFRSWSPWSLHLMQVGVAEAKQLIGSAGIDVPVVEAISQWSSGPGPAQERELTQLVNLALSFGASTIVAAVLEPTADLDAAAEGFALACAAAADHGLRVCLEFLPWSAIPDLRTGWDLVQRAGAANGGLLLDTWHWMRQPGGPAAELLRSIPGERIHYVQLCDAAPDTGLEPMRECMSARLPPGEGTVDFAEFWAAVDATGAQPIVTTEVFNTALANRGPQVCAEAVSAGLETILDPA